MATTTRYPIRIPLRLPRPIEPTESPASKPHHPQTPNLPPTLHTSAPCFRSKQRQPTRSNLHSLNSWPAVQCNEGFCNAPQSQCFTLTRPRRRRNLTILRICGAVFATLFHMVYDRADSGSEAAAPACPLVEHILAIRAVEAELTEFSSSRIRAGPTGVSVMWTPNASSACSNALIITAAAGI